ncbi:MAG TPA: metalloregulator ArsR/SmtB family transcription factor [Thermoanaerobaculia bacterium]|nr:metalloregulator ArsR/SmtB family transcription factor [Thermoanaerobaculia bacterium]
MPYDSSVKTKEVALDTLFQALGDRTRLRLLNLIEGGEVCVCFLVEILEAPQPKISRHLAYLRRAGLVKARRDGKWMSYSLASALPPATRGILAATLDALRQDSEMKRDRAALMKACCSPRLTDQLLRAPRPAFPELPSR